MSDLFDSFRDCINIPILNDYIELLSEKSSRYYNKEIIVPKIELTLGGTTAGRSFLSENIINLNPVLFVKNRNDFIYDTTIHELAHIIVFQVHGKVRDSHGNHWRSCMKNCFNIKRVCKYHNYDTSYTNYLKGTIIHLHTCKCSEGFHRKLSKENQLCEKCNNILKYIDITEEYYY